MTTSRNFPVLISLLQVVLLSQLVHASQPAVVNDVAKRGADRQARAGVIRTYRSAKASADNAYIAAAGGIVRWLYEQGAQEDGLKVVAEMKKVNESHSNIKDFEKMLAGIKEPKALDALKQKDLAARLKTAGKARAEGYRQLAERCYRANMMGQAYDLVWEMVKADPDNSIAWTAINRTKTSSGWLTKFDAEQEKAGNVYLKGFGWVARGHEARVQAGEWYEGGRWMSAAAADQAHATIANPWLIETDNFILKSSASRLNTMKAAERLEDIRQLCFRRYVEFFTRGSNSKSTALLFNQASEKKMVVFYFGSQAEFKDYIRTSTSGPNKEVTLRSAGVYSPTDHASFFYYDASLAQFQLAIMQHEVTHQILGEYAGGAAPTWVMEGVASVLENACYDEDNRLVIPKGSDARHISGTCALLGKGKLPAVGAMMTMPYEQFHSPETRLDNYLIAGAISCFLLEHNDGVHAADFLEYLHDAYRGQKVSLTEYLGMDVATLDREFKTYLQACQTVSMKRDAEYVKQLADQQKSAQDKAAKNAPVQQDVAATNDSADKSNPFKKATGKNVFDQFSDEQDKMSK